MKTQNWFCEICGQRGEVEIEDNADVFSVVLEIEDSHTQKSPHCANGVSGLRLGIPKDENPPLGMDFN